MGAHPNPIWEGFPCPHYLFTPSPVFKHSDSPSVDVRSGPLWADRKSRSPNPKPLKVSPIGAFLTGLRWLR
ncbi:Uncharacterised protein [Mycobacteroides abscessus subsp. bolletii]|nr:Uncharacterised protein [Mycobacteroides abscessus subsp. bolletii]